MNALPENLFHFLLAIPATLAIIYLLLPIAHRLGLVDVPNKRKNHQGEIPLVGGIAIYLSLLLAVLLWHELNRETVSFLVAGAILVLTGAWDDCRELNVKLRIIIEMVAASVMVFGAEIWVGNLGNLLGFGEIHMPFWLAYPFTLVAVFGVLNAMNMIDGIDAVAGGISLIALTILLLCTDNSTILITIGPVLVASLWAYLAYNLKALSALPKIFLGDAGSKLLGLTLVWALIDTAQSGSSSTGGIEPVTALYIIGLPLFDMVTTTVRRLKKGLSPFAADRTHIHHILQRSGFSKSETIIGILLMAATINLIGLVLSALDTPEVLQLGLFVAFYLLYAYNIHHAWKLSKRLKKYQSPRERADQKVSY